MINMLAPGDVGDAAGFCTNTANVWQVVGIFLLIFKIAIPIILIILGMVDLGKAVIASKEGEISKAAKSLLMRVIAAICIFFIPTLVSFVVSLIGSFNAAQEDYNKCARCISNPYNEECATAANAAWGNQGNEIESEGS